MKALEIRCPTCNQNMTYSHSHLLQDDYYIRYDITNSSTQVYRITLNWGSVPTVMGNLSPNTKIETILTIDGVKLLTMERVQKLLLLK